MESNLQVHPPLAAKRILQQISPTQKIWKSTSFRRKQQLLPRRIRWEQEKTTCSQPEIRNRRQSYETCQT
jgi:hypothetical protein